MIVQIGNVRGEFSRIRLAPLPGGDGLAMTLDTPGRPQAVRVEYSPGEVEQIIEAMAAALLPDLEAPTPAQAEADGHA